MTKPAKRTRGAPAAAAVFRRGYRRAAPAQSHEKAPDGQPRDRAGTDAAAEVLLDQLTWWGLALRDARSARALV